MVATLRRTLDDAHLYVVIASLVFLGCGDPAPVPPAPLPSDAGADSSGGDVGSLPEPPAECDQVLPSAAMDTLPSNGRFEELFTHTRAVGDDVYYRSTRHGGIWAVTVPETTPRLVVPPLAGAPFQDFWIE